MVKNVLFWWWLGIFQLVNTVFKIRILMSQVGAFEKCSKSTCRLKTSILQYLERLLNICDLISYVPDSDVFPESILRLKIFRTSYAADVRTQNAFLSDRLTANSGNFRKIEELLFSYAFCLIQWAGATDQNTGIEDISHNFSVNLRESISLPE